MVRPAVAVVARGGLVRSAQVRCDVAWQFWLGAFGKGKRRYGQAGMKGEELKKMRNDLGLTVAAAAQQVEVHPRTWSRWEAGERGIPRGVIKLFCMVNGITLHE